VSKSITSGHRTLSEAFTRRDKQAPRSLEAGPFLRIV
jgi:hypothetical protein